MSTDGWECVCVCFCVCVCVIECYLALKKKKKKENPACLFKNMDEPGGHYAKGNKPDT